jgi:NAD+ kinase
MAAPTVASQPWSSLLSELGRAVHSSEAQHQQLHQRISQLEAELASLRSSLAAPELLLPHAQARSMETSSAPSSPLLSPRDGSAMRRVPSLSLRQERSQLGRPVLVGTAEELELEPHSAGSPAVTKARFRLLSCNDESCATLLPVGGEIRQEQSSRSLTKLTWDRRPTTALVVKKPNDGRAASALLSVAAFLGGLGCRVLVEPVVQASLLSAPGSGELTSTWTAEEAATLGNQVDFCVCLGGDGTILWAASLFARGVPPVISFALGSLGFLTPFAWDNHQRDLEMVMAGDFSLTCRTRLVCRIIRSTEEDKGWAGATSTTVLNEVVIDRGPSHSLVALDCFVDGMPMTRLQADGIIVATPTGSTAYSLAAGGSMVHPGISAILFTPVCAHALSSRPLILPDGIELRVSVCPTSRCTAWAAFDGRGRTELQRGDTLCVRVSPFPVPSVILHSETDDFFRAAKSGLFWNQRSSAARPWTTASRDDAAV